MPRTVEPTETEQFSVTMPKAAVQLMMQLKGLGLYGTTRGEIARALVQARLEDLVGKGMVQLPRGRRPK